MKPFFHVVLLMLTTALGGCNAPVRQAAEPGTSALRAAADLEETKRKVSAAPEPKAMTAPEPSTPAAPKPEANALKQTTIMLTALVADLPSAKGAARTVTLSVSLRLEARPKAISRWTGKAGKEALSAAAVKELRRFTFEQVVDTGAFNAAYCPGLLERLPTMMELDADEKLHTVALENLSWK